MRRVGFCNAVNVSRNSGAKHSVAYRSSGCPDRAPVLLSSVNSTPLGSCPSHSSVSRGYGVQIDPEVQIRGYITLGSEAFWANAVNF
jgi:hypothetical protein